MTALRNEDGMTKVCTKCKETQSLTDFNRHQRAPDGYQWYCRECTKTHRRISYSTVKEPQVPMAALITLVDRWKLENTVSKLDEAHWGDEGSGWVNRLSELSGLHVRTISRIMHGGQPDPRQGTRCIDWVTFDTADKLTSAMECNQEWTSGCLAGFYGPLSVKKYERHLEGVL